MEESYKLRCKFCSQHLRAFDDLAGEEIECPRCAMPFEVLTRSEAAKKEAFAEEHERLFSVEELQLLKYEEKSLFRITEGATNRNCWEFGLLGALIRQRLNPFRHYLIDDTRDRLVHEGPFESHAAFLPLLDQKCSEYLILCDMLYKIILEKLNEALYSDNLVTIIELIHQTSDNMIKLFEFHDSLLDLRVPDSPPYPEIIKILRSWTPYCWQNLFDISIQLERNYQHGVTYEDVVMFSAAPPSLVNYFILRQALQD